MLTEPIVKTGNPDIEPVNCNESNPSSRSALLDIRQFKNEVHQCLMIIHRIPQKGFDSQDIFEDDD